MRESRALQMEQEGFDLGLCCCQQLPRGFGVVAPNSNDGRKIRCVRFWITSIWRRGALLQNASRGDSYESTFFPAVIRRTGPYYGTICCSFLARLR